MIPTLPRLRLFITFAKVRTSDVAIRKTDLHRHVRPVANAREKMKISIFSRINTLTEVNWLKTVRFNLHYFPLKTAVKLPFFIYRRTVLYRMQGRIVADAPVKTGMVRIGLHGLGTQDRLYARTIWDVYGTLRIRGTASIGRGSRISISSDPAVLTFGDNFIITGDTEIICGREITFGRNCLLSWDILIMDTDFHKVLDDKGKQTNAPRPIVFGDHVWTGCRVTVLKGVTVGSDNIISAGSVITGSFPQSHCAIGGNGKDACILKTGISWEE